MFKAKSLDEATLERTKTDSFPLTTPIDGTHTFYILPHTSLTKTIKIYDISDQLPPTSTIDIKKDAKAISLVAKAVKTPYLTITRGKWYTGRYTVHKHADTLTTVAEWKAPTFAGSPSHFTFPSDSEHASHALEMKPVKWYSTKEVFVQDSATFAWKIEGWGQMKYTLFKMLGEMKMEVGKYWQTSYWSTGGVVVLDEKEVDKIIGLVTVVGMMRKKRQRDE